MQLRGFQLPVRAMREMQFTMARPDRALLARVFREVDVVHVQFPFWLGEVAVDEARRAGRPVIAAFHVQPENALMNVGVRWPWLARRIYRYWVSHVFNRADAVVCPTRFAERKLREHGVRAPVHVVSNGVPPDLQTSRGRREARPEGALLVLAVGRFAAEKRQDVVIEAVRRSRHRDRDPARPGGWRPQEAKLRALADGLPHPAEIGFLPRERLARLLASADLFVHASEVELEGIAVLEAMSAGLPVLVAREPRERRLRVRALRRLPLPGRRCRSSRVADRRPRREPWPPRRGTREVPRRGPRAPLSRQRRSPRRHLLERAGPRGPCPDAVGGVTASPDTRERERRTRRSERRVASSIERLARPTALG